MREIFKELWGRPTTTADFRSSFWQIHHASNIRLMEDKIQDWGTFLFTISYGSFAVDQRSGVGWFSGWSHIFVLFKRNSNAKIWSTRCEDRCSTESSIVPNSKERSVWRNKKPQKRTVSFVEERSLTCSTSTSGSLEPMIPSRTMPTYLQVFFEVMIFRNSIRNGTEFYCQWRKSHLMTSWKDLYKLRIRESEKLKTVLELYKMEIHRKKAGPDGHRLKTMVKRSIEQNLHEARHGNYERNACWQ